MCRKLPQNAPDYEKLKIPWDDPPNPPSARGYTYHTLLRFYFNDIQELLPKFIREIAFENINKMTPEFPTFKEIGVKFCQFAPPPPPVGGVTPQTPSCSQLHRLQIHSLHTTYKFQDLAPPPLRNSWIRPSTHTNIVLHTFKSYKGCIIILHTIWCNRPQSMCDRGKKCAYP